MASAGARAKSSLAQWLAMGAAAGSIAIAAPAFSQAEPDLNLEPTNRIFQFHCEIMPDFYLDHCELIDADDISTARKESIIEALRAMPPELVRHWGPVGSVFSSTYRDGYGGPPVIVRETDGYP